MTTAQRDLLTTTLTTNEDGLQIYNTDKGNLELFNGQFWESAQTPIGTVMAYSGATIPKGWALCDGTSKFTNDVLFHDLFLRIGNTWGGDGTTTFNLPDLRAATLRGTGISTKFTSNVTINLGQLINDQFQGHYHNTNDPGHEHANPARIAVNTGTAYNIWSYTGASIQDSYTTRQTANITILDPSTNASNG
jgi:microcystin-dependent protein